MHEITLAGTKLKAWVHYGDDFPMAFTLFENDGVTPKDMTGKTMILGLETNNSSVLEITGIVSGNEVTFNMDYSAYNGKVLEGKSYKFDFWNETDNYTEIEKGDIEFRSVAHKTEG